MIYDDGDEVVIGDNNDDDNEYEINYENLFSSEKITEMIRPQVMICNKIIPIVKANLKNSNLTFQIPSKFLPPSLQMVCGFYLSETLINVSVTFKKASWKNPVSCIKADHPVFHQSYVGRPLVYDTIRRFFTNSFKPKESYNSFNSFIPKNELIKYEMHPLIILILEICDCFLDIQDHCCICHEKLPFVVIKPSICNNKLCELAFNEIGVGSSVAQEIRRDPSSADLLISIFSTSFQNKKYMNPAPPQEIIESATSIFESLPSMDTIASECQNDSDIIKKYGTQTLDLLRWVILSNKSQLIQLPTELKLKEIPFQKQYMSLIASPEKEKVFQEKKKIFKKSVYMWHGSSGDRWHSILRNGLMNMSNIDCVNGAVYGPGIYLANNYQTSLDYSRPSQNLYTNSKFGNNLNLISLCEVVPVKDDFKVFPGFATLQDEKALIVRFIFPIDSLNNNACMPLPSSMYCQPASVNRINYNPFHHYYSIHARFPECIPQPISKVNPFQYPFDPRYPIHVMSPSCFPQPININQEIEDTNLKNIPKLEDVIKYLEKKYMNRSIHIK